MITNELKKFAAGNTDFDVAFDEYYDCKNNNRTPSIPMYEMAEKVSNGYFAEIERLAGVKEADCPNSWMANPQVQWVAQPSLYREVQRLLVKCFESLKLFSLQRKNEISLGVNVTKVEKSKRDIHKVKS